MCCTPRGVPTPFLGMLEKVRVISGIRKQQPRLPGSQGKVHPMLNSADLALCIQCSPQR